MSIAEPIDTKGDVTLVEGLEGEVTEVFLSHIQFYDTVVNEDVINHRSDFIKGINNSCVELIMHIPDHSPCLSY